MLIGAGHARGDWGELVTTSHSSRRVRRAVTAGFASAGLLLAACGSSKTTSTTTSAATTTTVAATTTAAAATTTAAGATTTTAAATTTTAAATTTTAAPVSNQPLIIARDMDTNSTDPSRAYCDTCQIFLTAMYETLLGLDQTDNKTLVPRLAEKWSSNADETQFTFNLNPKATFSDGSPVTSADVKFSWERLKGVAGAASYLAMNIKSIDTPDPETVVANFEKPNSAFFAQTNASYMGIINSKVAQAQNATTDVKTDKAEDWFLKNSAGSGPYVLESYTAGTELRMKRNDKYWGAPASFPEVVMKETKDAVTQRQQLEQGAVDIAMQISNDVAKDMKSPDVTVTKVPSFNFVYLALSPNVKGGEKLTPDVRKAIRLALDYDGLLNVTVGGSGHSQPSSIPNGFAGTEGLAPPKQDLDTAKSLLAKAGVKSLDLDTTFPTFNVYGVDFATAAQKVQADLKAVGINLKLNPVEASVWGDKIASTGIPVTLLYFAPDHTDSSQYIQYFALTKGSQWQTWAKTPVNTAEDDLLVKAFGTKDDAARAAIYKQLAQDTIDDQIIIPLVNPDLFLASRSNIKGMHYSACCNLDVSKLSRG
jgi:peptide/nickel transport system substrate-binding protein